MNYAPLICTSFSSQYLSMSSADNQSLEFLIDGGGSTSTNTNPSTSVSTSCSNIYSGHKERLRGRMSEEAMQVLLFASRALSMGLHIPISASIAPLCTHLNSLRSLLPHTTDSSVPSHRSSCVIMDTLVYLNQMTDKMTKLKEQLKSAMIEVKTIDIEIVQVQVRCKARNGIMANILEALEGLELMFETFDMRYFDGKFDFKAQCTFQGKDRGYMDVEVVKEALQKVIYGEIII